MVDTGRHQVDHRQVRLVAQRDEPRDTEPAVLQQGGEVEHQVAALAEHRHRAGRQHVVGQLQLGAGVDHSDAVRPDQHRARRPGQAHHLLLRKGSVGAELGEPGRDHDEGPSPCSDGVRDRLHEIHGGHADHHQVERFPEVVAGLRERASAYDARAPRRPDG